MKSVETVELRAAFAASSAHLLLQTPVWSGIQIMATARHCLKSSYKLASCSAWKSGNHELSTGIGLEASFMAKR